MRDKLYVAFIWSRYLLLSTGVIGILLTLLLLLFCTLCQTFSDCSACITTFDFSVFYSSMQGIGSIPYGKDSLWLWSLAGMAFVITIHFVAFVQKTYIFKKIVLYIVLLMTNALVALSVNIHWGVFLGIIVVLSSLSSRTCFAKFHKLTDKEEFFLFKYLYQDADNLDKKGTEKKGTG